VQDGIKSTEKFFQEELFFGTNLPTIDLDAISDDMGNRDPFYSFMKHPATKLPNGSKYMFDLQNSLDPSKQLIDADGWINEVNVRKYLKEKKKGLRKLMASII
jgi:hypothetical protein